MVVIGILRPHVPQMLHKELWKVLFDLVLGQVDFLYIVWLVECSYQGYRTSSLDLVTAEFDHFELL